MIEAKRAKRLNVMAALLSNSRLVSARFWQTSTADLFVGFVALLRQQVDKPLTITAVPWLKKHGVTLYFLPAYSPELNRIERLWHKIKHTWMDV